MKIIKRTLSTPLGIAFVIAFVMLFLFSPDSYTHDLFGHYDSAWFFTCGKAWMNGLVPYDDFADSKGPLLWLIYGVGYLFTPHSYIGVFWLSVFLYTGIFYYVYHTAHLFLANHKLSVATVMIMAGAYFCAWYHTEIRAEDWCCLFVAMSLYHVCRLLFGPARFSTSEVNKACCALGIGMAGTLLIKFNMTIMLGTTALYVYARLFARRKYSHSLPLAYGWLCVLQCHLSSTCLWQETSVLSCKSTFSTPCRQCSHTMASPPIYMNGYSLLTIHIMLCYL